MSNRDQIDLALLMLRCAVGGVFLMHGLQKLGVFGGEPVTGFAGMLEGLKFAHPVVLAWIVASCETLGGLFLILGIMPKMSALVIAVIMVVAIVKVHGAKGFFMMDGGFEYPLFIVAVCVAIMMTGGGKFSVLDRM